jgi:anti-sigma B factor antagonist
MTIEKQGVVVVVRIIGRIDQTAQNKHRDRILEAVRCAERVAVLFDVSQATAVNSPGLGFLVTIHKQIAALGGAMGLMALPQSLIEVLAITGLNSVFLTHDSVETFQDSLG